MDEVVQNLLFGFMKYSTAGEEGGMCYMTGEEEGGEHPLHGWGGGSTWHGNTDLVGGYKEGSGIIYSHLKIPTLYILDVFTEKMVP